LVAPDAVILECPFDRLTNTLGNRLRLLNIPPFPLAQTIAFWVGVQHGFNGLAHNPVEYARTMRCPVLLMQGENDVSVGQASAHRMAAAFGDRASIKILPGAGHANLVRDAEAVWRSEVRRFLAQQVSPRKVLSSQCSVFR
jgi:pimeloyl-ACP methyl ester carboxylesterase